MLKDIRDSLARPPRPNNNRDDNDDNDDNDNMMMMIMIIMIMMIMIIMMIMMIMIVMMIMIIDLMMKDMIIDKYDNFLNNLNTNLNNIQNDSEHYARLIAYQNLTIGKLKKELTDKNNLTQEIIDQARETIDDSNKERLKYYNKYKNTLVDYTNELEKLNKAENTYGKEIANLNNTINELRNKIQN